MPGMQVETPTARQKLCRELDIFAEKHPGQKITADRIKDFVCKNADCFERTLRKGHITGSAWLLNPSGDKVLLTLHHKLKRWMQTGGHADGDGCPLRVALREAEEESGIKGIIPRQQEIFDIDIHLIPENPHKGEASHYHYDIRYLLQAPHECYAVSPESDALAWWVQSDFEEKAHLLDASTRRMARRYYDSK